MKNHLIWSAAVVAAFGAGALTGRQFPTHHYQKFGESRYVLDTTTGQVCDPVLPATNLIDGTLAGSPPPGFVVDKPASVPTCPFQK